MTPRLEFLYDPDRMTEALTRAGRDAVLDHARHGRPVSTLRDGQLVWIQPEVILAEHAAELARAADA